MDNPLLDFTALPRFADVRPDHITPAVDQVLANARAVVAAVTQPDTPASWDALMAPLADATRSPARGRARRRCDGGGCGWRGAS